MHFESSLALDASIWSAFPSIRLFCTTYGNIGYSMKFCCMLRVKFSSRQVTCLIVTHVNSIKHD
jgi:hypothetical protein